jgi:outer membrane protein assembly factor BamB
MLRAFAAAALFMLIAACSTNDNSEPPAELSELENPEFVKLLWSTDSGKGFVKKFMDIQPLTIGKRFFTIDTLGVIEQLDVTTGKKLWSFDTGLSSAAGPGGDESGLVATSRDGDVVFYDFADHSLKQRWKQTLSSEIRTRPVVDGGQVFVRLVNGELTVLDAKTGSIQWNVSRRVPSLSLTGSSFPVITEELVIGGFDNGKLVAFSRGNGSTVWEHTVSTPHGRSEIERLVDIDGQFLLRDNVIYVSSFQGNLIAITLNSGEVLWSRKFSSYKAIEADAEALYLTDDRSNVWSIDRRTGSAFWKQDTLHDRKLTAPRLIGDRLVVADLEGYVHFLNKSDGAVVARIKPSEIRFISQPTVIDQLVLVNDMSGQVFAVTQDRHAVSRKDADLDVKKVFLTDE